MCNENETPVNITLTRDEAARVRQVLADIGGSGRTADALRSIANQLDNEGFSYDLTRVWRTDESAYLKED